MKKEEANDIIQSLLPKLNEVGISNNFMKIDTTTNNTGNKRGDIWISNSENNNKNFEKDIIALIEAKHRKCIVGDLDWRDAMRQGKEKSKKQLLNFYIVTNCELDIRFYNTFNDEEISLDGKILTFFVSGGILNTINTQISEDNSNVYYKTKKEKVEFTESEFRKSLKNLADIYRSASIKKGDETIAPTVSFVVLKYISEKEKEKRSLNESIKLWDDLSETAKENSVSDLRISIKSMIESIWGDESEYKNNEYKDFKHLVNFPSNLKNIHFKKIYKEFSQFNFHGGAKFDLFGSIYEEFASQTTKKDFGEYYTRRHITKLVAKLLLRNEKKPRNIKICDPACGTGGFLTEAFKELYSNYEIGEYITPKVKSKLRKETFWGYDQEESSVARAKLNMFLVGDGHTHIYNNDSLNDWQEELEWTEDNFDYILANPPMGQYKGDVNISHFSFTNESRYQLMFLEKIIKATIPGGEMAIIIDDGVLETPSRANFRKKLIESCFINAIISLPKFAFAPYTKEKTYVLFLKRKEEMNIYDVNEKLIGKNKENQKFPMWHFIIDYDGYANSDKRYKTKYHDDIVEVEEKFDSALKIAQNFSENNEIFHVLRSKFERKSNKREVEENIKGYKSKFVFLDDVNENNNYNLLCEFHLRNESAKKITLDEANEKFDLLIRKMEEFISGQKIN